jgi:hypothetical protein
MLGPRARGGRHLSFSIFVDEIADSRINSMYRGDEGNDESGRHDHEESVEQRMKATLDPNTLYSAVEVGELIGAAGASCLVLAKAMAERGEAVVVYSSGKNGGRTARFKIVASPDGAPRKPPKYSYKDLSLAISGWNLSALLAPYDNEEVTQ